LARNVAWGIDIGESAVKAVKVRRVGDSAVIQDYRTVPCETRPEEAQGSDKEYRVRNALSTLQREVKLKGAEIAVSMPGRDVFPRFISLPPVEKKRIPELVRYEARTQMPFPIEEVIWDYQPLCEEVVPGEEVEVALFAIKRASVYSFLTNLRLGGLLPDIVEISPLALYNFLMYDRSIETGTVVIDIGAGNTDLVILDGEKFWTRNVSISGNDITRALQEKYQISFEEAENLKRKAATSKQAEKLFGVMRPILDDLVGEIQRSIGYYKAQSRNVRIDQVVLLGNAFKLKGLIDYFRKNLDYDVSLLDSLRRVKLGTEGDTNKFEAELPNYGAAIGLALQALGLTRVGIDLMPRDVVRSRILRRKIPWAAAAVALLAVPIALGFANVRNSVKHVDEQLPGIEREISEYERLKGEIEALENPEPMLGQLKELATIGTKRQQWVDVFDSLNAALNDIKRERFLVRHIREVTAADFTATGRRGRGSRRRAQPSPALGEEMMMMEEGGMGPPGAAPPSRTTTKKDKDEPKVPAGLIVEVAFEKMREPKNGEAPDGDYLRGALRPRKGVSNVVVRSVDVASGKDSVLSASAAAGAASTASDKTYIYTVWVTFSDKPEAEEKTPEDGAKTK